MINEFKSLTNSMVLELYQKSITAYELAPRIMPANDRYYLLHRKESLRSELIRRKLISL